jgi:Ca-activated chloride channel family protein
MTLFGVFFAFPYFFLLLLLVPFFIWQHFFYVPKKVSHLVFPDFADIEKLPVTLKERLRHVPFLLRMLAMLALVVALARPQSFSSGENIYSEGVDIALVLDISGSMLAEDFKPNRLEAAKNITQNFIDARTSDRIGLVVFSRSAFTQCPMTVDYHVLKNLLMDVKSGMIEDGTAIGNAIANGVNRLKDSKAKSKALIVLTDGINNAGEIDPLSATDIALHFGIRIYTIGIGTIGQAPYPVPTPFGVQYQMVPVEIDENLLRTISKTTDGKYFRATGNRKLEMIYDEIDKLEKSRIEVTSYQSKKELFYPWAFAALLLLFSEILLSNLYIRRFP